MHIEIYSNVGIIGNVSDNFGYAISDMDNDGQRDTAFYHKVCGTMVDVQFVYNSSTFIDDRGGIFLGFNLDSRTEKDLDLIRKAQEYKKKGGSGIGVWQSWGSILETFAKKDFSDLCILKLGPDGKLDKKFGNNGKIIFKNIVSDLGIDFLSAIFVDKYGKIYIAGYGYKDDALNSDIFIIKLNYDGSFDEVFASSGKLMVNIDKNDYVQSLYVDSDGRIYLVGYSCNVYNYYSFVIRFNSDGTIDNSFGYGGRFVFDGDNYKKSASSLDSGAIVKSSYFDKNGKIYITGDLFRTDRKNFKDSDIFILRLLNNGKIDFSFANNGKKIITDIFSKNSKEVSNFICVYEGEIILGASAHGLSDNINDTSYTYSTSFLMAFDINGNVYKSFAENGIKKFLNVSNINYFKGIGDVFYVAAGSSLIRLKSNGTIDDSFGYKGKIVINDINFVNHKGFQEYYVGTGVMFTDIRSILYYKNGVYVTFFYYPLYRNVEYHEKVDESFILVMKVE